VEGSLAAEEGHSVPTNRAGERKDPCHIGYSRKGNRQEKKEDMRCSISFREKEEKGQEKKGKETSEPSDPEQWREPKGP